MAKDKNDSFFNSTEFQRFLSDNNALLKKRNRSTSTSSNLSASLSDFFKSKDSFTADILKSKDYSISDIFKSKEAFSNIFSSLDWQMTAENDKNNKYQEDILAEPASLSVSDQDRFRSRDWMTLQNLGDHVDVSYTPGELFNSSEGSESGESQAPQRELPTSNKTNWGDMFYSQLYPSTTAAAAATAAEADSDDAMRIEQSVAPTNNTTTSSATTSAATNRKRRRPAASKKKGTSEKEYVNNPTDVDVLLGRGGKSNHHPGNKRYREEIKNFQTSYLQLTSKEEKTDLTRFVVDYVHKYNGRFLSLDKNVNKWYVAPDVVARRKVSQALREDDDPVKRAEKRARYLKKKMAKEAV